MRLAGKILALLKGSPAAQDRADAALLLQGYETGDVSGHVHMCHGHLQPLGHSSHTD